MATARRLRSSAASPAPSCTTTPSWQSPASIGRMGSGSERASSRNFRSHYLSRTGSVDFGQGQRQYRKVSRVWSASSGRNFLVPVPRAESFEALNDALAGQCRRRQAARLRGHKETIGERLARDREAFLPLPPAPYDACDKRLGRVSSLSLVRCRGNDYSVPVAYGHREVLIRCYVDEVRTYLLRRGGDCPAPPVLRQRGPDLRRRSHYLPLIEQKIGALDQAAPLAGSGTCPRPSSLCDACSKPHGQGGQARVRPGAPSAGDLPARGMVEGAVGDALGSAQSASCGEALGTVPHRAAAARLRSTSIRT